MSEHGPFQHATSLIPIATGADGHAYIGVDAAVALLRAIANSCRNLADDPACGDLRSAAVAIDREADNLDCRAIEHTT